MADLDNFFAKKDRKKAKGKKFATTDEVAKKLEETGKRLEKPKKEKPVNPEGDESPVEEEDEWKEFEEEKKDYSGLKIGVLTINDSLEAESDDERGTGENSSDGESGEGGTKNSGPWKKPDLPEAPEAPAPSAAPAPAPAPATGNTSYKAPHLRNQPTFTSPRPRGKNVAPDINSEEYFPTLSSKAPQQNNTTSTQSWGRRRRDEGAFEEVRNRGGSRYVPDSQAQAPKLSLGNKYGALSQDQS